MAPSNDDSMTSPRGGAPPPPVLPPLLHMKMMVQRVNKDDNGHNAAFIQPISSGRGKAGGGKECRLLNILIIYYVMDCTGSEPERGRSTGA